MQADAPWLIVKMSAAKLLFRRLPRLVFQNPILHSARAFGVLSAELFAGMLGGGGGLAFALLKRAEQSFAGKLTVRRLRAGILHGDAQVRRQMPQRDPRRDLVDVLAARARGMAERFLKLGFV